MCYALILDRKRPHLQSTYVIYKFVCLSSLFFFVGAIAVVVVIIIIVVVFIIIIFVLVK